MGRYNRRLITGTIAVASILRAMQRVPLGVSMEAGAPVVYVETKKMHQNKRTVIDILRDSPGFVSGEAISQTLGVSRNAVHKHVNSLRKRGYDIVGVSRRGYKLEDEPTALSMALVSERTEQSMFGRSFRYHDEIESTEEPGRRRSPRGHRRRRRAAVGRARTPWTSLDVTRRQGPSLLRGPAPAGRHGRRPPADDRRRHSRL